MLRAFAALIALTLVVAGCGRRADVTLAPPDTGDGWRVSTPHAAGLDSARLARGYDRVARGRELRTVTSLLVVRDGALVAEGYFGDGARERLNDVRSVAKSVTSLLVGIAMVDGAVRGVDQPLAGLLPDALDASADPRKRAITLADLLSMRSGLRWDEHAHGDLDPGGMAMARNSVRAVLAHPVEAAPGRRFTYSTGNTQLVAAALQRATGQPLAAYARERLFAPLGIRDARWDAHADGTTYGGMRLFLRSRDLARIGQLALDRGAWNGRRLVPAGWIAESTARQVEFGGGAGYGYGWWVRPRGFAAQGWGGQYVYVFPRERMVVVLTADPNAVRHVDFPPVERFLAEYVIAAVGRR